MDFGVLSKYDDLLATYFLDSFYLWFSTVRMNMDFVAPKIDTTPSINIIREQIVNQRDPSKAALEFLKIPFFQEYLEDKTDKRKLEFTQHLKRYMYMFMPNAGFEINSTKRYTGTMEACIVATRDWEAGEQVTCCQGAIAELNSEEDAKLKKEGRDFSVMVSTRKKCTCLFLGPARFMNHDCNANCEFILLNQNAITFRIKRNIAEGDEMTVFYGEHYFGEDNCECLCASCEERGEGKYSPPEDTSPNEDSTSSNCNNTSSGTSPTPSLSSCSSSRDRGSGNNKNDKNPRRSSRKRKDISYADYFEPAEPKKTRRGRCEKQDILEETTPLKNTNISSNGSVDMENIDPSQTLLCTLKKQEPTRHQEMKLDFICADMAPSSADEWIRIATHPLYEPCLVLKENNVDKEEYYSELNAFEPNRVPGESILVPVPPLKSARPCVTTNTPQKTFQGSFKVDLDVQAEYMADLGRMRIESRDDEEFYDKWTDGLSACSDVENVVECCPQYDEATANSETHMCARCHRHKIIYDLNWPVRKIRKAPGKRRAPKKTPKQQQQQQALNPTVLASNIDPSLSSSSSSSSLHKPQPRHILAKPEPISASSPFPISPSAQNLFTSSYLQPCPLPVAPVTPLPPVPEQQFHHHSPTSPSPISATTSSQQQNLFADTLDSASTIEKFGNIRISSLPPNPAMRPMMLGSCVNQVTDSISEELDKNDMPSCSRQFNSLVPHVSVEPLRE